MRVWTETLVDKWISGSHQPLKPQYNKMNKFLNEAANVCGYI